MVIGQIFEILLMATIVFVVYDLVVNGGRLLRKIYEKIFYW